MKLFDKIRDLFMDEILEDEEDEYEDIEEAKKARKEKKALFDSKEEKEEKPKKDVLPTIMRETIKKEEPVHEEVKVEEPEPEPKIRIEDFSDMLNNNQEITTRESMRKNSLPLDFEKEFEVPEEKPVVQHSNVNILNVEREVVKKKTELYPEKEVPEVKSKFRASPVISPVYGVLDKNYTKEEVREKDEEAALLRRASKKVDFETVRKKAFGNLADEIKDNLLCENCELYKEVKKISALTEDDLLYDMTVDENEKDVTIEKAYDNYEEFGVAYENKTPKKPLITEEPEEKEEDTTDIILNNMVEDKEEGLEEKIDTFVPEEKEKVEEVVEEKPEEEKKKDTKVDEDFFELIDSMYKERVDE